ncbi:class I SAM-dependent rRNA methyltransferase [Frigoriglobus tundricola]|uniref:23S rRNA (Cytosine(1962)-C(5))-methyltransferase n=1 Tax=Frigoriglobus tundricola TaxID=2774151 RepID=A0A6M5Z2N2_9BACT|nr:class I SAM-dependent rRNA methyltransferase [Frigoriglobus tundricola]QJW99820.1 23S rRNA (cytosine(1962)-C(5))-methyltransferase [Frigoriglobus tundricola]
MNPAPEAPSLPRVTLKIERRSSHPWIFQKMVEKPATRIPPGSVVDVHDKSGQWVARGFYNGHSRISLRVLTSKADEPVDDAFFARKIAAAVSFRRDALKLDEVTDAYRLVHSEADGLSGLVVDRFGDTLVMEFFAAGMYKQRGAITDALRTHYPAARFYYFAEEHVGKQESFDCRPPEPPAPDVITEHGLKFRVAPGSKHKTGFFVDQRDNRKTLSEFCAGKRVLDICCNTGGFGVYAKARGGAAEVVGLDLDEQALDMAKQNAKLNNAQIRYVQADLFAWLRDIIPNGERFDTVVLDPAKLTRDREDVESALKKYCDMNRLALHVVKPGGVLLTCSCTGLVSEADFLESIRRAAWQAQRTIQVFKVSGAGADHPFLLHVPEGRYLKAVFCRVE